MIKTWTPPTGRLPPEQLRDKTALDHDEMHALAARLRGALDAGDFDGTRRLLNELLLIEVRHFAREDALMRAIAFDDADAHRAEHVAMLDAVSRMVQTVSRENLPSIRRDVVAHVETVIHHMKDADGKLDRFAAGGAPPR